MYTIKANVNISLNEKEKGAGGSGRDSVPDCKVN